MSIAKNVPSHAGASAARTSAWTPELRLAAAVWLAFAVVKAATAHRELSQFGATDPDALMRLVEVRDYVAGAAWTDLLQPRLDPPGVWMHWSRLVDWPLAALLQLLTPILGREAAETTLLTIWPLLLLGPCLFGMLALTRRLVGPSAAPPTLAFTLCSAAMAHFAPGDIDHHNVQIVLLVWMLAAAVRANTGAPYGAAAGLLAALSLSIGLETLLLTAFVGAGLAMAWAARPRRFAKGTGAFGLTFAVAMAAQRLISAPPAQWLAPFCDVASAPYVGAAIAAGGGLYGLTAAAPVRFLHRALGLAAVGAASAGVFIAIHPPCVKGPFGDVDPRLMAVWFHSILEARNIAQMFRDAPGEAIGFFLAPIAALGASAAAIKRAPRKSRPAWAMVTGALAVSLLVATWAVRAVTFASLLAVPALAWLVLRAREAGARRSRRAAAMLLAMAYLAPNQTLDLLAGYAADRALGKSMADRAGQACAQRPNYGALAVLPKGLALAPSNLGPALLAHTPHSVVAANYHRNAHGVLASMEAFESPPDAARAIVRRLKADYVVICLGAGSGPRGSLLDGLASGTAPGWLEPAGPADGRLRVWRVRS